MATPRQFKRRQKDKKFLKRKGARARTGRFTYFPDKQITRSWRITKTTDDKLRDAGQRVADPERVDPDTGEARRLGAADVLETLATLYADKLTIDDVKRAAKKVG